MLSTNRCKGSALDGARSTAQCLGSPAERRVVRYGEIETEQSDDGSDQPLRSAAEVSGTRVRNVSAVVIARAE